MSHPTEEDIRKAATWKAFKEGKDWFLAGGVSHAEFSEDGWRGVVSMGRRPLRVAVQWRSATDVVCRCACPANQSTGEFCSHAVAVAMHLLAPAPVVASVPHEGKAVRQSWSIRFAPNWMKTMPSEQLSVMMEVVDREVCAADERLARWLSKHAPGLGERKRLSLRGGMVEELLAVLVGHVDLAVEGGGALQVTRGGRLAVRDFEPRGAMMTLERVATQGQVLRVGQQLWWVDEGELQALGDEAIPRGIVEQIFTLVSRGRLSLAVSDLLRGWCWWQSSLDFAADGWLRGLKWIPVKPQVRLDLDYRQGKVQAQHAYRYPGGAAPEEMPQLEGATVRLRDELAEQRVLHWMRRVGFVTVDERAGTWVLDGGQDALGRVLAEHPWPEEWERVESASYQEQRRRIRILRPSLKRLQSGSDWLDFAVHFETDEGAAIAPEQVGRYLRGGQQKAYYSNQWKQTIETLIDELASPREAGGWRVRGAAAELFSEWCKNQSNEVDSQYILKKSNLEISERFEEVLRPYQRRGVEWMWERMERYQGALLSDDMGLGKTLQTIVLIESLLERKGGGVALVVMTASLLGNWRAEWEKFAPGRRVLILHGAGRDGMRDEVGEGVVVLTTYATLGRDLAWHLGREYEVAVADEASLIRNPDTDQAKAMFKLRARQRLALTGTPMENGVGDLWSIFRWIQPGWLGSRKSFEERYPVMEGGRMASLVMERLRWRIRPFVLRRTKEEVAPELPAKWVMDEVCDLSERQWAVYRDLLVAGRGRLEGLRERGQAAAARMQMLTLLLRLRQSCGDLALLDRERFGGLELEQRSGKLARLMELLEEAMQAGRRVLVFSQFREQLLRIEELVQGRGWQSLRLDGQSRRRQELVDRFQSPDGPPIFLISLKAGGYGLNLTAADMVVHFDPWWNPAVEAQATDRAHRLGQQKPVTVYRLLTRDTVEEKVVAMQERKRGLAAVVDETGEEAAGDWSLQELERLLAEG